MAKDIRPQSWDDDQRDDREAGEARQESDGFKILSSSCTQLEMEVICMIFHEACNVKETAYILQISEKAVKRLLWNVTERFLK